MDIQYNELEQALKEQLAIDDKQVLTQWLQDPYLMDSKTNCKFWDYIKNAPAVRIVGDYDVDGQFASYIMSQGIHTAYPALPISIRIPRRMSEGYGINPVIAQEIKDTLPPGSVIITVDNGIAAADVLEDLQASGYHVLLTDHHELGNNRMPEVDMVLNPKAPNPNQAFDGDYWCGAAVAFKLVETMITPEKAKELEVYAGIATIADCMPLREGNWGLVRKALHQIQQKEAPEAVLMLLEQLKKAPENCTEETIGYYLAPCFNAPGRLFDEGAKQILGYLLKPTFDKCVNLVQVNKDRRTLCSEQTEMLKSIIQEQGLENDCPLWVYAPGLHEGIVGILAGHLAEEYGVPAIVLTDAKEPGMIKGSARTVGDVNIFNHLLSLKPLFDRMGGHAGAAGLTMSMENLSLARKEQFPKPLLSDTFNGILCHLSSANLIPEIAQLLNDYGPFGEGNISPEFTLDVDLTASNYRYMGDPPVHLSIMDALYKITHFYHTPNELQNQNKFTVRGNIQYDFFRNIKTPSLLVQSIQDNETGIREMSAAKCDKVEYMKPVKEEEELNRYDFSK